MSSQDRTLSINFTDSRSVAWAVGRLMSRGHWFEYRPNQLAKNGMLVDHTLIMLEDVARDMVQEFKESRERGEI